jgi:hypothetical protein
MSLAKVAEILEEKPEPKSIVVSVPKKPTKLRAVDPKKAEPSKPKILIYGKPGVGKTWTSLDFPAVYYIDTEGGADLGHYTDKLKASGGMYFGPEQESLDFETVIGQIQALATEEHPFRTVLIDSISKLYNSAIAHEAEALGDKDAFGASKKPAIAFMRRLVNWLTRLDMNVILIAHERPEWGIDSKGQRTEIGSTFDAWDKLEYELHLCLNIIKAGPARNAKVRKSRLTGFPDGETFTWSYTEFATRYGKDVIEKQTTQIILASAEQLEEVGNLIRVVKLPDGQEDKWLKAAGVDGWEEMDQDKVVKIIDYIRTNYINQGGKQ